jgi:predicted nucleotidyltransferase
MNSISINISGRIDPERIAVLRGIKDVADELGIRFFVVGAFARDVIFEHIHRIPAPRITEDIDPVRQPWRRVCFLSDR